MRSPVQKKYVAKAAHHKTLREDAHSREVELCRKATALGARMCWAYSFYTLADTQQVKLEGYL